ncbi:Fluoroacetate dehalogenase [Fusarium oxysporum f. sp. albedinis]|nr:Fluoroacetate dehalogenase [Fusarium oxysporum f. sp. albedinis]
MVWSGLTNKTAKNEAVRVPRDRSRVRSDKYGIVAQGQNVFCSLSDLFVNTRYACCKASGPVTAEVVEGRKEMYFTSSYQSIHCHSHYPRYHCHPQPGAFHIKPGDTHKLL